MLKPKKTAKKRPQPRANVERPYSNGQYSEARFRSFAMSALRRARWGPKQTVLKRAFTRHGINPETGCKCMFHACDACHKDFPKGKMRVDHREPVIPIVHDWQQRVGNFLGYDWNEVMRRLWPEEDGFEVFCEECHAQLTKHENDQRRAHKASQQP